MRWAQKPAAMSNAITSTMTTMAPVQWVMWVMREERYSAVDRRWTGERAGAVISISSPLLLSSHRVAISPAAVDEWQLHHTPHSGSKPHIALTRLTHLLSSSQPLSTFLHERFHFHRSLVVTMRLRSSNDASVARCPIPGLCSPTAPSPMTS